MRLANSLFVCTLMLGACNHDTGAGVEDGWVVAPKTSCPAGSDMMATPIPKCAAAKDLPGDNLFCVDFTSLSDQRLDNMGTLPAILDKWDFVSDCPNTVSNGSPYWEIKNQRLIINNFPKLSGVCGFIMPPTDASSEEFKKHSKFTVSVIQTLNLSKPQQSMGIYLNTPQDGHQIWSNQGKSPRQVSTVTIEKAALNGTNGYQPVFQFETMTFVGLTSMEIESIAVNASQ